MNESSSYESLGNEIPEWRRKKYTGRPKHKYNFETGSQEEREPTLPERLYREVGIEDLYFIWRDKEMPLQHFQRSSHSGVEENSVGNFWFTQPVTYSYKLGGYIITEPKRWKNLPEYVQNSSMAFKSDRKRGEMGKWGEWQPRLILSHVPEVHTGNRLSSDELTICIFSDSREHLQRENDILMQWSDIAPDDLNRQSILTRIAEIQIREHGEDSIGGDKADSLRKRELDYGNKWMQNSEAVNQLKDFYRWALSLPVIPHSAMPEDIDSIADDKDAQKRNEDRFLKFYQGLQEHDHEKE